MFCLSFLVLFPLGNAAGKDFKIAALAIKPKIVSRKKANQCCLVVDYSQKMYLYSANFHVICVIFVLSLIVYYQIVYINFLKYSYISRCKCEWDENCAVCYAAL